MPFQKTVNTFNPPAVEGDFASSNPRVAVNAGEGGLVAGSGGVIVGRFAWIQSDGVTVLNTGTGSPDGFVHREQQALITGYLSEASNVIPQGFPITLLKGGDFFAKVTGSTAATRHAAVSVNSADGTIAIGAPGTGQVATGFNAQSAAAVGELAKISSWGN